VLQSAGKAQNQLQICATAAAELIYVIFVKIPADCLTLLQT